MRSVSLLPSREKIRQQMNKMGWTWQKKAANKTTWNGWNFFFLRVAISLQEEGFLLHSISFSSSHICQRCQGLSENRCQTGCQLERRGTTTLGPSPQPKSTGCQAPQALRPNVPNKTLHCRRLAAALSILWILLCRVGRGKWPFCQI